MGALHAHDRGEDEKLQAAAAAIQVVALILDKDPQTIVQDAIDAGAGWIEAVAALAQVAKDEPRPKIELLADIGGD